MALVPDAGVAFAGDLVEEGAPDLCRRVLAGELAPEDALRRGPYPAETVRMALERARATTDPIDSTGSRP